MAIGVTLLIVAVLVASIWIIIEMKRMKHKIVAIFLIALILFVYLTGVYSLKGEEIDWKTVPGVIKAGKIYFVWLGGAFGNMKSITTNAIEMDWSKNSTG